MERSSKRGKIPQQDWPSIIARYEGGETLASIARTYDCSPPAISYILSRSRARATAAALAGVPSPENPAAAPPQGGGSLFGEARLAATAAPADPPSENAASPLPEPNAAAKTDVSPPRFSAPPGNGRAGNGASVTGGPGNGGLGNGGVGNGAPNGELRRTLRLSSGSANGPERNGEARNGGTLSGFGVRPPARALGAAEPPYPQPLRPSAQSPAPHSPGAHSPGAHSPGAHSPGNGAPVRVLADPPQPKEGGGALDQVLRERVHADLAAFLAAFDAALADDTSESRTGLREATDRLLRAGARTRIELERLEARLPLPGREAPAAAMPYWRQR